MHRLPRRERWRLSVRSRFNGKEMVVERWQLRGNQEDDHRRRAATKTISQPDARDGRRATNARASFRRRGICLEFESQIDGNPWPRGTGQPARPIVAAYES